MTTPRLCVQAVENQRTLLSYNCNSGSLIAAFGSSRSSITGYTGGAITTLSSYIRTPEPSRGEMIAREWYLYTCIHRPIIYEMQGGTTAAVYIIGAQNGTMLLRSSWFGVYYYCTRNPQQPRYSGCSVSSKRLRISDAQEGSKSHRNAVNQRPATYEEPRIIAPQLL